MYIFIFFFTFIQVPIFENIPSGNDYCENIVALSPAQRDKQSRGGWAIFFYPIQPVRQLATRSHTTYEFAIHTYTQYTSGILYPCMYTRIQTLSSTISCVRRRPSGHYLNLYGVRRFSYIHAVTQHLKWCGAHKWLVVHDFPRGILSSDSRE